MDQLFLKYYSEELTEIRHRAADFGALNDQARHLMLSETPCPDPYVERLLEGVAYLAARTRLKVDTETARLSRDILEALYPDLAAPTPAVSRVVLEPGAQVTGMYDGYHVPARQTRLIADPQDGIQTRATYTTAQDVTLWPIRIASAAHLAGRSTLEAAGLSADHIGEAEAALRIEIAPTGADPLSAYSLDSLDIAFDPLPIAGALFDAVHGQATGILGRPAQGAAPIVLPRPEIPGTEDSDALFPRTRSGFGGYRLLREYFVLPEKFHGMRLTGLAPAVATTGPEQTLEIFVLLRHPVPQIAALRPENLLLFATTIANLFEKDCSTVDVDTRHNGQIIHPDRARPRDFEIHSLISVKDLDRSDGDEREIPGALDMDGLRGQGVVYSLERRARHPSPAERSAGKFRTTYHGDDLYISLSRPRCPEAAASVERLDIRALCTNRELPILDHLPQLTPQSGIPVDRVRLLAAVKRPGEALRSGLLYDKDGAASLHDTTWRLVAMLSLNFLSLAEDGDGAIPLRALLDIYAERGDPQIAAHARALERLTSTERPDRLPLDGPICFGSVTDITLQMDDQVFGGYAKTLLGALLSTLFERYASLNAFVRCAVQLTRTQETITWPMTPGSRRAL